MKWNRKKTFLLLTGGVGMPVVLAVYCWFAAASDARRMYDSPDAIPHNRVALVLGCSPQLGNGRDNLFFKYRMAAAARLFHARKADYLLVSGDNHRQGYDEPTDMKYALIQLGVPEQRIVCDYAGFTTLDSIVRANRVFLQQRFTIVSQKFHNQRALFIAEGNGLECVALNARDVNTASACKTYVREIGARIRAWLDVKVLRRNPHFLGAPVPIP